jgi:hypothetical protein
MFWRQFNGSSEKGVPIGDVKKMLAALCDKKEASLFFSCFEADLTKKRLFILRKNATR